MTEVHIAHVPALRLRGALGARALLALRAVGLRARAAPARAPAHARHLGARGAGARRGRRHRARAQRRVSNRHDPRAPRIGQGHRCRARSSEAPAGAPPRLGDGSSRRPQGASSADRPLRARPWCAPRRPRSRATPRARVRSGELKGTITGTECGPLLKAKARRARRSHSQQGDRPLRLRRRHRTRSTSSPASRSGAWASPSSRPSTSRSSPTCGAATPPPRASAGLRWPSCAWTAPAWRPRAVRWARATVAMSPGSERPRLNLVYGQLSVSGRRPTRSAWADRCGQ